MNVRGLVVPKTAVAGLLRCRGGVRGVLLVSVFVAGQSVVIPAAGASAPAAGLEATTGSPFSGLGSELVGLRTRTSRTFARDGGSGAQRMARVYSRSVNYQAGSGAWEPIDNALVAASGEFRNKAGWFDVRLPSRVAGGDVAVREGSARVAFSLRGADAPGVASGSKMTYAGALPGVDVSYEVMSDWLKELITLKSGSAQRAFVFDVKLSKGLRPQLLASGAIAIRDTKDVLRMAIAAPYMTDADGNESRAARFALDEDAGGWRLTLTADDGWLDAPGRAWPVQIDPQVFPGAQADCTLDQSTASTNYCGASTLSVGGASTSQKRSVLRFDIAGAMPFGSTVTAAALGMKLQSQSVSEALTIKLHRLSTDYFSGATWNSPWSTAGGDFPTASDCQSCPLVGGGATGGGTQPGSHAYWWMPALVEGWANGTINNRGMLLKADALTANGNVVSFASNEAAVGSQPFIDTTYEAPARTGEYPQSTFETQSLTDRSGISVNVANGNLLLSNRDLQIAGTGLDLVVGRYYNGLSQTTGSHGKAWKMGTGQDVELYTPPGAGWVTVRGASGELLTFTRNTDGTYASPPGLHATLAYVDPPPPPGPCEDGGCDPEEPEYFKLTDHASGGQLQFTGIYNESLQRLIAQRDRYGNTIRFTYSSAGKLSAITDTQNRVVTVTQNNGRIERLTDQTGRMIQYGYDAQGRLATYTDADSKQMFYGYDISGRLASITTPGGRVTKVTYDTQGRVKTIVRTTDVAHTTGPTTGFDYSSGAPCATGQTKTVVSDPEAATSAGHTVTYCGDASGRVAQTVDSAANATSLTYGATGDVASVTLPGGGVTNYNYDAQTRNLLCVQRGVTAVQNCQTTSGGQKTTLAYANTDALTKHFPTTITNPQGKSVAYCYNGSTPACGSMGAGPAGSLQTMTNGLTVESVRSYVHHSNGNLASATDARGNTTEYGYDSAGNRNRITPEYQVFVPIGSTQVAATQITSDALSRPATVTDGKGQTATYTYDNLDHVKDIVYKTAGGVVDRTISHTFDNDGAPKTLTDPSGVTTYTVDDLQRLTREAFVTNGSVISYTHDYTYDAASNLKTLSDGSGATTYTYNGLNQLASMREPLDTQDTTFSYNSDGARTQITYTSGVTVNWGYHVPSGRITSVINKDQSGTVLKSFAYTYLHTDSLSVTRDTDLAQTVTDELGNKTVNSYDALDRLTDAVTDEGPNDSRFHFELDGNGNRASETINLSGSTGGATKTWAYDEANLPCWRAGWTNPPAGGPYNCSTRPLATLAFVQSLNHDANGADIDNRHQAFTYNTAGQPTAVTADTSPYRAPAQAALGYRGAGQSQLIKDGAATVQQNRLGIGARGAGTTYYPRANDGTLISERPRNPDGTPSNVARRNYLYDASDSVVGLTDTSGDLKTSYRYDPHGHPQNKNPTGDENPFGYAGTYMAGLGTDGVLCGGVNLGPEGPYDAEDGRYTQMSNPLSDPLADMGVGGMLGVGMGAIGGGVPALVPGAERRAQAVRDMRRSGNPARAALGDAKSPIANARVQSLKGLGRGLLVAGVAVDLGTNIAANRGAVETGVRTTISTGAGVVGGLAGAAICGPVCAAGGGAVGAVFGGMVGDIIF